MAAAERWNEKATGGLRFERVLVHTGQHYDERSCPTSSSTSSRCPRPDELPGCRLRLARPAQTARHDRGVRAGAAAARRPTLVLVVGDVNSTLACALVGGEARRAGRPRRGRPAQLRPHACPRRSTASSPTTLADLLFTTAQTATRTCGARASPDDRVHLVGNTMIDTLVRLLPAAEARPRRRGGASGWSDGRLRAGHAAPAEQRGRPGAARRAGRACCDELAARRCRWCSPCTRAPAHAREPRAVAAAGGRTRLHAARAAPLPRLPGAHEARRGSCSPTPAACRRRPRSSACRVSPRAPRRSGRSPTEGTNRLADPYDPAAVLAAIRAPLAQGPTGRRPRSRCGTGMPASGRWKRWRTGGRRGSRGPAGSPRGSGAPIFGRGARRAIPAGRRASSARAPSAAQPPNPSRSERHRRPPKHASSRDVARRHEGDDPG